MKKIEYLIADTKNALEQKSQAAQKIQQQLQQGQQILQQTVNECNQLAARLQTLEEVNKLGNGLNAEVQQETMEQAPEAKQADPAEADAAATVDSDTPAQA